MDSVISENVPGLVKRAQFVQKREGVPIFRIRQDGRDAVHSQIRFGTGSRFGSSPGTSGNRMWNRPLPEACYVRS